MRDSSKPLTLIRCLIRVHHVSFNKLILSPCSKQSGTVTIGASTNTIKHIIFETSTDRVPSFFVDKFPRAVFETILPLAIISPVLTVVDTLSFASRFAFKELASIGELVKAFNLTLAMYETIVERALENS